MLRLTLAVIHLLGLAVGLGAVWARARVFAATRPGAPLAPATLRAGLVADNWWGASALLLLSTGLWRALAGTEKAPGYYAQNHVFWAKMGVVALILVLELAPMVTLVRWRLALGRAGPAGGAGVGDGAAARRIARASHVQAVLVALALVAAAAMARGYGARG